jgi:hypothetical protein
LFDSKTQNKTLAKEKKMKPEELDEFGKDVEKIIIRFKRDCELGAETWIALAANIGEGKLKAKK